MSDLPPFRKLDHFNNGISLALLLSVGLTASPVYCDNLVAAGVQTGASMPNPVKPVQSTTGTGLRAFIDPNTGKLRAPTEEELRQPGQPASARFPMSNAVTGTQAPAQKLLPSGAISMEVGELGMSYAVAKRNPDGSVLTRCDTESKSAQQALHTIQQTGAMEHTEGDHDR